MSTTVVHDSLKTGRGNGQLALKIEVLARRWSLDRRLVEGALPESDAALRLRARQLTGTKNRRKLASSLMRAADRVSRPNVFSPTAPLDRRAVAEARPQMIELSHRLEDSSPVGVRGVAMIHQLLTDGTSPMYSPGWTAERSATELSDRLSAAARALDAH
ncbi:MAG TPA: hypothetical protein VH817_14480 [Thermoleophilaceae bacterium]|jgi:hypothetical protein